MALYKWEDNHIHGSKFYPKVNKTEHINYHANDTSLVVQNTIDDITATFYYSKIE